MDVDEEKVEGILCGAFGDDENGRSIVLAHSRKVAEVAVRIASSILGCDVAFVKTAALLHDIGRSKVPPGKGAYRHGVEGGRILRDLGLENHALVAERHLGGGISEGDIDRQGLDLPVRDYLPLSIEEKVVCFADKIVSYDKEVPLADVLDRFSKEIGPRVADRIRVLHDELAGLVQDEHVLGS
ncbi:MAG: HD domain-containing protein [archaeon]